MAPQALNPEYLCDVNEPVILYDGEGVLSGNGQSITGRCQIRFAWTPTLGPEVVFHDQAIPMLDDDYGLDVPEIGLRANVSARKVQGILHSAHGEGNLGTASAASGGHEARDWGRRLLAAVASSRPLTCLRSSISTRWPWFESRLRQWEEAAGSYSRTEQAEDEGAPAFVGIVPGHLRMGNPAGLSEIRFHLANFPHVLGATIERGRLHSRGRIHLEDPPWRVDIDPVPDDHGFGAPGLAERLGEARGFAITHVGVLAKTDGTSFAAGDADDVLQAVSRTVGLVRAADSVPCLMSGVDSTGEIVWRDWTGFRTDPWAANENWFSKFRPEILQSVFAGWRRISATANNEVINAAAHLYIDCHNPRLAMESKLVLAQAALEGLAQGWPHPPLPAAPALPHFNSGAAARIAEISRSLGLPLAVPAALPDLLALQQPSANAPALEKMAWVRNSIAHLGNFPRLAAESWRVKYEAFQLAAWHLELALLRLLDADGVYLNRLSARNHGDVSKLPWVP